MKIVTRKAMGRLARWRYSLPYARRTTWASNTVDLSDRLEWALKILYGCKRWMADDHPTLKRLEAIVFGESPFIKRIQ